MTETAPQTGLNDTTMAITSQTVEQTDGIYPVFQESTWTHLYFFFAYRIIISALLLTLFFSDLGPNFLGQYAPRIYVLTTTSYLGMVLASGILLLWRHPSADTQASLMVFVDIAAITMILPTCGGVQSGLGTLLALSIAAGSLIISGPKALLLASVATLSIISQQLLTNFTLGSSFSDYPQAGLVGSSFFAIAILAHVLSRRLSHSERLVSQQELDLANLAQLNEYIIQNMQTGILVVDQDDRIRLMNESAWFLLGMPDARADSSLEQASPMLAQQLASQKTAAEASTFTLKEASGGRKLQVGFSRLGTAGTEGSVIFLEDVASVTQRAQQMKLASLGRLTASIAHEIRNPLGAISHAGQLLRETTGLDTADQRLVEIIHGNSERVNQIIENVLQLSRRKQAHPEQIDLLAWLEDLKEDICRAGTIPAAHLGIQIIPEKTQVRADQTQLQQIIVNLCENSVRHFDRDLSELRIRINGGVTRESGGPFLEVIDNGPGITPDILRQAFEPFFTTNNSGTGLGLYIAKEMSESNRLNLEHVSLPSGGCCFRLVFPAWQAGRVMT